LFILQSHICRKNLTDDTCKRLDMPEQKVASMEGTHAAPMKALRHTRHDTNGPITALQVEIVF